MDKRAEEGELLKENTIYIILLILFLFIMFYFVMSQRDSASLWSDLYAKELVKVINLGDAGDEVWIDIHTLTEIAQKNEVAFESIVTFDNTNRNVCVKLTPGRTSCYGHFRTLEVRDARVDIGVPTNVLYFKLVEPSGGADA